MLNTIDPDALSLALGGGAEAVTLRNCPGGAMVVQEGNQLFAVNHDYRFKLAPGVTADQYCEGSKK